jgi:hypothetical protein
MKLGNDPRSALVISPIERAVLDAQAERLGPAGPTWLAQCRQARVVNRSHSGVGFVTRFEVPADAAALADDAARRVGAVYASHPALREPAEFLIQVKEGRLASIEAFCFDGMWPPDEADFRITRGGG